MTPDWYTLMMKRLLLLSVSLLWAPMALCQVTLHVLGVGQDAGYPQAGCFAPHCMAGWQNERPHQNAVSLGVVDHAGNKRYLFEATPDFPAQYYDLAQIAPAAVTLNGIFLTHAHIGHYSGLMYLGREAMGAAGVPVYAMPRMAAFLSTNGPWSQLVKYNNIAIRPLQDRQPAVLGALTVTPVLVPHRDEYSETVGFYIAGPQKRALFIPDIDKWARWSESLVDVVRTVDYAFLDATFFADGELPGRDMSRIPHPFIQETMALMVDQPAAERAKIWFIHMNHTNPALWDDTPESEAIRDAGFNIARQGLAFDL